MEHDLVTIWNKIVATMYDKPERKQTLLDEVRAMDTELHQFDVEKWCIKKGFGKAQILVVNAFKKEILGEK